MKLAPVVASILAGSVLASHRPLERRVSCNGNAAFCDRKYSNVSLVGTHDSAFVGSIIDPSINQEKSVPDQLDAGIRFLQAQTHNKSGTLEMCHTSCALHDAGSLTDYLGTIKTWLDENSDDVVTLLLTNGDFVDVSAFDAVFRSTGIKDYAFVPSASPSVLHYDDWPTYQELIDAGVRLITFLDYGADMVSVPYILDEFSYFFETAYDVTDKSDFLNCSIDRPPGATAAGRMSIINHFLDVNILDTGVLIPDDGEDYTTNAATGTGSIGEQISACEQLHGRTPNFILVDMFDRGDVFAAQNSMNRL